MSGRTAREDLKMAVTAVPRDKRGAELDAAITAATTQMNTLAAGAVVRLQAAQQLELLQQQTVIYYMSKGRLTGANILATMT